MRWQAPEPEPRWAGSSSEVAHTMWSCPESTIRNAEHCSMSSFAAAWILFPLGTCHLKPSPECRHICPFLWGTLFSFKTYQEMGSCSLLYNSLMAWTLVQETGKVGSFPRSVWGDTSPLLRPHWTIGINCPTPLLEALGKTALYSRSIEAIPFGH